MSGWHLAVGLLAAATGVAAWRLGWRQGHAIARYQAAVDAVLDPSIDHSGCASTISRLSDELATESSKLAMLRGYVAWQDEQLDMLRGDRPLITPTSFQFDEIVRREWGA